MTKMCELHDRECIDCGECDICDLDQNKKCDNCGKCIDYDEEYAEIEIESVITEETGDN